MLRNKYGFRWGAEIEMNEIVVCNPVPIPYQDKTILFKENTLTLTTETLFVRPQSVGDENCFCMEGQFGVYENDSVLAFIENCIRFKEIL
jgi:hypothetical protein